MAQNEEEKCEREKMDRQPAKVEANVPTIKSQGSAHAITAKNLTIDNANDGNYCQFSSINELIYRKSLV